MSQLTAEQLAQRVYECGLMSMKQLEDTLRHAGGRGRATFDDFIMASLEQEMLTNWQISRVVGGHRRGYFYGNWKVLYLIGAGTFARVYRAAHKKSGDIKAVKVLRQRYSNDMDTREQFLREARMVMALRHSNIVPIHEVEEDRGRIYMVMDFVEGQNLREYVKAHKKLPLDVSLRIVRDIAAGLKYAADHQITHRDMKLSNVLLSSAGQAKLVDFGLAAVAGDEQGGPRSIDYAGLEKATNVKRNDERSDLYFLGAMLYQLVSGVAPLEETRERIRRLAAERYLDVEPITNHVSDLPHRVVVLIGRLMEPDADKRIQTPAEALRETEIALAAVEGGDVKEYDADLSAKEAGVYRRRQAEKEEGLGKTILIIESNNKLQDRLRERLKNLGYRVLITGDVTRGLARFEDLDPADERPADCVIFGCVGLGKQALASFAGFVANDYTSEIPAILIVPENLEKFVNPAWLKRHRIQMSTPIKLTALQRALRKLLKISKPDARTSSERQPERVSIVVNDPQRDTDVE